MSFDVWWKWFLQRNKYRMSYLVMMWNCVNFQHIYTCCIYDVVVNDKCDFFSKWKRYISAVFLWFFPQHSHIFGDVKILNLRILIVTQPQNEFISQKDIIKHNTSYIICTTQIRNFLMIYAIIWWETHLRWHISCLNPLWPSDTIWQHRSGSTYWLMQWLTTPSHYRNPCWLTFKGFLWHSAESNLAAISQVFMNLICNMYSKIKLLPNLSGINVAYFASRGPFTMTD